MTETLTLPAAPKVAPANSKSARAPRADYDQQLANDITAAGTLITNALGDATVLAALTYSEAELREGLALHVAAQTTFAERQRSLGTAGALREQRDAVLEKVVDEFKAYRTSAQNSFPKTAHVALGANGRVPSDVQKLLTLVRSAYQTAQSAEYLPTLEKRKITGAVLLARLADAENLERLDGRFKAADQGSTTATKARNEAGDAMREWLIKFRKQAKSDLRRHPELLAKLGNLKGTK